MKPLLWPLGLSIALACLFAVKPTVGEVPAELVDGNNQFAWKLYGKLAEREGNLIFSPESISTALAMTYVGARGETAEQMVQTLHFSMPADELAAGYAALLKRFHRVGKGSDQLAMANRLWGQRGYEFRPEFLLTTREFFGAELGQVDFGKTESARQTINDWVADQTADRIENLLPSGAIDSQTKLVLTNAVYFLSDWQYKFNKATTRPAPFYFTETESADMPMMNLTKHLSYANADGVQVLSLPYRASGLSMIILLPEKRDGLSELESKLDSKQVDQWLKQLKPQKVRVYLPRFKMSEPFRLKDVLSAMGMPIAFSEAHADFSGTEPRGELCLSAVVHKAFIEVNERGTEAAAATAVTETPRSIAPKLEEPIVFRADHPFVFMIRDRETGSVLFLGRVNDPRG